MSLTHTDRFQREAGRGDPDRDPSLQESYAAVPSSVPAARHAIVAFAAAAGARDERLDAIRLASSRRCRMSFSTPTRGEAARSTSPRGSPQARCGC